MMGYPGSVCGDLRWVAGHRTEVYCGAPAAGSWRYPECDRRPGVHTRSGGKRRERIALDARNATSVELRVRNCVPLWLRVCVPRL